MSNPSMATEQLLELLLQLKKTTPAAARQILNSQPQIAYALITLMVSMNAINFDVFQVPITPPGLGSGAGHRAAIPTGQYATPPPTNPYGYQNGASQSHQAPPAAANHGGYPQQQQQQQPGPGYPYGQPPQSGYSNAGYPPGMMYSGGAAAPTPAASIPDALSAIPEEQKALIMRVLSMTPEQINSLGPTERATFIQLRATLGAPI
ncbi:hypothetical protein BD779DRAFT_1518345 [Infundibulicybe gibba]|nr:hypothetical protein BD779DRAFT_1518345 [Infundibulicybe gibba]